MNVLAPPTLLVWHHPFSPDMQLELSHDVTHAMEKHYSCTTMTTFDVAWSMHVHI